MQRRCQRGLPRINARLGPEDAAGGVARASGRCPAGRAETEGTTPLRTLCEQDRGARRWGGGCMRVVRGYPRAPRL